MDQEQESDIFNGHLDLIDTSSTEEPSSSKLIHQSSLSKGFCVKEYEEQLDNLKKENFNLKLRLYFLEQNSNASLPEGIENFQKQFTDLKVENETLSNELNEKQQLLQQASLALELLEEEKLNNQKSSESIIIDLQDKVKYLEQENLKMQDALSEMNKSNLGNDTGYADFLGAVDMRDIELQRKVFEMSHMSEEYKQQINRLQQEISNLNVMLKDSQSKASTYKYERDEIQDKFEALQSESKLLSNDLEIELKEFKEKWAATQCELIDVEEQLKESEEERQKTLKYLTQCLQNLDDNREKISALESMLEENQQSGMNISTTKKDAIITDLKMQLDKMKQQLKQVTSSELEEKNNEIQKLSQIISTMKNNENKLTNKSLSETPRISLDMLYESFNDLKFQQAMQIKQQSQKKVNELIQELISLANTKNKKQFNELKEQMAIVVDKQAIAEDALNRCAELCTYTLNHLYELAQFLSTLLSNKEIRESLSNQSILNIQNILDKSAEFSRFSINADGRFSALPDLSMIESLISTRDSISNLKHTEITKVDKSIQSAVECQSCKDLKDQINVVMSEFEELRNINQLLEDEICEQRETLECRDDEINKLNDQIKVLKENEVEINVVLKESQNSLRLLEAEKINLSSKLETNVNLIQKLENCIKDLQKDLEINYIRKCDHENYVQKAKDEVVNAEAQTAAVRIELEEIRKLYPKFKSTRTCGDQGDQENDQIDFNDSESAQIQYMCKKDDNASCMTPKKSENSLDTKNDQQSLVPIEASSISCRNCPKYKAQVGELKKHLRVCFEKLKKHSDTNYLFTRRVEKQLGETENVMQNVRIGFENIFKNKENLNQN